MAKCIIKNCDEESTKRGTMCKRCASSHYYWDKKRPAEIVERRRKLNMYNSRLQHFYTDDGKKPK